MYRIRNVMLIQLFFQKNGLVFVRDSNKEIILNFFFFNKGHRLWVM
jgi:hypothetical protein